jgi:hypothetical protein
MAATYAATLPTDKDWVRFLCGDRDVAAAKLQDEEITALLVEERNKYLAAARACDLILARSGGLVTKQVGDLKLEYSGTGKDAYTLHAQKLREKGASLTISSPRVFKVYN